MKEYKVLTQKDKWFSGKFDPANLEQAINAYQSGMAGRYGCNRIFSRIHWRKQRRNGDYFGAR